MKKQPCVKCGKKIDPQNDFLCPYCGRLPIDMDMFGAMKEMIDLSGKLNNKINSLRDYFDTLNLSYDDERNQFLGSISQIIGWLNIQMGLYYEYGRKTTLPIPQKILRENPNISMAHLTEILKNFDHMNRRSFLTNYLFQVEVLLNRINGILPNVTSDLEYKNLTKHVLKELGMAKMDNEDFRILYFPALVRNSLHMNGRHTKNNVNGKICGIQFTFKKNKPVEHAGWRHVYFFCEKIPDVIEKILKHPLVEGKYIPTFDPPKKIY